MWTLSVAKVTAGFSRVTDNNVKKVSISPMGLLEENNAKYSKYTTKNMHIDRKQGCITKIADVLKEIEVGKGKK